LLGVLKIAKDKGLSPKVKPLLDQLIHIAAFRISKELYLEILETEG
jgi:predicted nucleic acid-binding protein